MTYHPIDSKEVRVLSTGKVFQNQQSIRVDSPSLPDGFIPEPLQVSVPRNEQFPLTSQIGARHPSHLPPGTSPHPSSELSTMPGLQPPALNGTYTTAQHPAVDEKVQGEISKEVESKEVNQVSEEASAEDCSHNDGTEDEQSSFSPPARYEQADDHELLVNDFQPSSELPCSPLQSQSMGQYEDDQSLDVSFDGSNNQSERSQSVCAEAGYPHAVDQLVSHNTTQSIDTGLLNTDFVTNTIFKPSTWSLPNTLQDFQCGLQAFAQPLVSIVGDVTHESCQYEDTSEHHNLCAPIQESPGTVNQQIGRASCRERV